MIRQWKGKQRVTPCAHTPSYRPIPSVPFRPLLLLIVLPLCFLISKRKRAGRDKGERIDKEECHLLCALFCLSLSFIHLSSILFFALPSTNAILFVSPLSFSLPSLLLFPLM